jgi:N-acetylmuramoyl-L-alanine amidase
MQKYKIMNIKTLFLVCFILTFFNIISFGQAKDKVSKVIIDAGHGGTMPGAVGKLCKEKEINLKVALQFGKLISTHYDDVTVIYTRKSDETVELFKRAEIANKNKADLFISIHSNSVENRNVTGVETFVMGIAKTAASAAIAKKENADILLEKDYKTNYSDFDPNSPEAHIVFSLYSTAYLNLSTILASRVQKHLVKNTKMIDRTVQQADFFVLYKVAMPSILVELGFISNAEEEKYLLKEDTQEMLSISLYNAFVEYKNLLEGTSKPYLPVPIITKPNAIFEIKETPNSDEFPNTEALTDTANIITDPIVSKTEESNASALNTLPNETPVEVRFRIQFFLSKENYNTTDKRFTTVSEVNKYFENGVWKYTSGNYQSLADAQNNLKEVKKLFSDAFIIAFNNERKISITEAQELLK